jgi:hypothetical protein
MYFCDTTLRGLAWAMGIESRMAGISGVARGARARESTLPGERPTENAAD